MFSLGFANFGVINFEKLVEWSFDDVFQSEDVDVCVMASFWQAA